LDTFQQIWKAFLLEKITNHPQERLKSSAAESSVFPVKLTGSPEEKNRFAKVFESLCYLPVT
jgi:hypothetical protein